MSCWTKEQLENMLEDVVNELNLSDDAISQHGPLGTPPAELVRKVLAEKDMKIRLLKNGLVEVPASPASESSLQAGEEIRQKIATILYKGESVLDNIMEVLATPPIAASQPPAQTDAVEQEDNTRKDSVIPNEDHDVLNVFD